MPKPANSPPSATRRAASRRDTPRNRRDRARERTRAALLQAAQRFIVEGRLHAPILEITQAADVGLGSFYNHFQSRDALFEAAVDDAPERLGGALDALSAGLIDPAERFAQSFRMTSRLFRLEPELMAVALSTGPGVMRATSGLVPRARRDLEAGIRAGRFRVTDLDLALALVVGASLCLCELLRAQPERDADVASADAAAALLRMLGLADAEATRVATLPLPATRVGLAAQR
ncbi:MAG: TetR/AcrR family transcriptional regulator [Candidatus Dormibacteraeota bacterium]|nr:TetR/AcrR family transcriptional regulator [Candidatus Dormibacteraeota bacterium]